MHPTVVIQEIAYLVRDGRLSQRQIAARLNVSRGVVSAIASGKRGLYGKEQADAAAARRVAGERAVRCRVCGYRVYLPCLICSTREYREQQLSQIGPTARPNVARTKRRSPRVRAN